MVIKPNDGGSTVGSHHRRTPGSYDEIVEGIKKASEWSPNDIIDRYIRGRQS